MVWFSRRMITMVALVLLIIGLVYAGFSWKTLFRVVYPVEHGEIISRCSEQYGLDPFLITAIILIESGFREESTSSKGAAGLMQVMPETANWVAQQQGLTLEGNESLYEPAVNIGIGSWYLNSLYQQFGNWVVVLAAYNAGRGNVQKWLTESLWSGELSTVSDIPFPETRIYVQRVIRAHWWYHRMYDSDWEVALEKGAKANHPVVEAIGGVLHRIQQVVYSFVER